MIKRMVVVKSHIPIIVNTMEGGKMIKEMAMGTTNTLIFLVS
jgi:hypothetical protein